MEGGGWRVEAGDPEKTIRCPRKFALFEVTVWLGEYTGHIVPLFSTGISREAHLHWAGRGRPTANQPTSRAGRTMRSGWTSSAASLTSHFTTSYES